MKFTLVCDNDRFVGVYLDGVFQEKVDTDSGYEIERLSCGKPCIVESRDPGRWSSNGSWPKLLHDVPGVDSIAMRRSSNANFA